jgi:hypothetical protein
MPKQHLERALEVVYLFAAQKCAINISLAAIGLLWNSTDLLGRSRAAAAAATAAAAAAAAQPTTPTSLGGALGGLFSIIARRPSVENAAAAEAAAAAAAAAGADGSNHSTGDTAAAASAGGAAGYQDPHIAGRSDLSEAVCMDLLLRLFTHFRKISVDPRPEVRCCCGEHEHMPD